jgi:hypothetical protein
MSRTPLTPRIAAAMTIFALVGAGCGTTASNSSGGPGTTTTTPRTQTSSSGGRRPHTTAHQAVAACATRGNPAEVLTCLATAGVTLTQRDAPLYNCIRASHDANGIIACLRNAT